VQESPQFVLGGDFIRRNGAPRLFLLLIFGDRLFDFGDFQGSYARAAKPNSEFFGVMCFVWFFG